MRFVDLQDEVKDLVNFTEAADKDFELVRIKGALNRRYESELLIAQQQGGATWFHVNQSVTWTGSTATLVLPAGLSKASLIELSDITDNDPGYPLPGEVFWLDHRTLQWGENGPAADKTIRLTYLSRPVTMVNDADEPELIPPEFRMLLVWSAAVFLRTKADEGSPQEWRHELNEARLNFWKTISRGRPHNVGSGVSKWREASVSGAQVTQDGSSISQDNN